MLQAKSTASSAAEVASDLHSVASLVNKLATVLVTNNEGGPGCNCLAKRYGLQPGNCKRRATLAGGELRHLSFSRPQHRFQDEIPDPERVPTQADRLAAASSSVQRRLSHATLEQILLDRISDLEEQIYELEAEKEDLKLENLAEEQRLEDDVATLKKEFRWAIFGGLETDTLLALRWLEAKGCLERYVEGFIESLSTGNNFLDVNGKFLCAYRGLQEQSLNVTFCNIYMLHIPGARGGINDRFCGAGVLCNEKEIFENVGFDILSGSTVRPKRKERQFWADQFKCARRLGLA